MNTVARTSDETRAALQAAATAAADVNYTRFDGGINQTHAGTGMTASWATIAQDVEAAAATLWPNAEILIQEGIRAFDDYSGDDAVAAFDVAIKEAKLGLPVVVWASLTGGRRSDSAVEWLSALFIDLDDGVQIEQVAALRKLLTDCGINHIASESATSRLCRPDGTARSMRFHFHIPIAPIVLPTSTVPRSDVKAWWMRVYAAAVGALTNAAGLEKFDGSVDDLSQPIFLPFAPPNSAARQVRKVTDGHALDLLRFLAGLGIDTTQPWAVASPSTPAAAKTQAPPAVQTVAAAPAASTGPTVGHSTGSLLMAAFKSLGRLGNCLDPSTRKYAVRCPWCEKHKSDPRQKMGQFRNDSSTVIYDDVGKFGHDGGFECKHQGSGQPGECKDATAADVLRWARKRGAALPDRPEFGGAALAVDDADGADIDDSPAQAPAKRRRDTRPRIVVRIGDVAGMRDQAIAALSRRCDVFVQNGVLVDLTATGPRTLPSDHLLAVLGESAQWVSGSRNEDGGIDYKPTKVPRDVVGAVLKAPQWPGIAELRAVVKHPPLLPDGRLITTPGYDAESKLLHLPDADFNVPASPTRADALAARDRLLHFVKNTNFCDPSGPSTWLAFLLTLAARTAMTTVPVFGFDAAVAGAGKTSLVKIAYGLVYGELPQLGAPVVASDEEAEKRLPMWARQALVCWDNVKHTFGSPVVDNAITAGVANTRVLGINGGVRCDLSSTSWAMTGNNLAVGDDAASRCVIARIAAPTSRRYDFAVDDVAFYQVHRPRSVADCLTILRAFLAAGSPQTDAPYCRFVEWSRLIRQALLWLGMADPIGTANVVDVGADAKAEAMRALYRIFAANAFHAADIDTSLLKLGDGDAREDDATYRARRAIVDALSSVVGRKVEGNQKVGYALQKLRDVTLPLQAGGVVRFVVDKVGAKTAYRLDFDGAGG